jgi:hypothetical protein
MCDLPQDIWWEILLFTDVRTFVSVCSCSCRLRNALYPRLTAFMWQVVDMQLLHHYVSNHNSSFNLPSSALRGLDSIVTIRTARSRIILRIANLLLEETYNRLHLEMTDTQLGESFNTRLIRSHFDLYRRDPRKEEKKRRLLQNQCPFCSERLTWKFPNWSSKSPRKPDEKACHLNWLECKRCMFSLMMLMPPFSTDNHMK